MLNSTSAAAAPFSAVVEPSLRGQSEPGTVNAPAAPAHIAAEVFPV